MSTRSDTSSAIQDIRGVLIQVEGARLLLPNASISEVLSFATPEPIADAPAWLLGRIRWRGWMLPLVSFAQLSGLADEQGGLGNKVVILKALGGDETMPHFALLTQGFPRLVTVPRDALAVEESPDRLPTGVQMRVLLKGDAALVPDIGTIEDSIRGALDEAA
jgi:chemosensory pili system protein ChpC